MSLSAVSMKQTDMEQKLKLRFIVYKVEIYIFFSLFPK